VSLLVWSTAAWRRMGNVQSKTNAALKGGGCTAPTGTPGEDPHGPLCSVGLFEPTLDNGKETVCVCVCVSISNALGQRAKLPVRNMFPLITRGEGQTIPPEFG